MKDLVIKVSKIFNRERVAFVLVGAFARDLYFEKNNIKLDVRTKDIDFGILVDTWDNFSKVKSFLKEELKMAEEAHKSYRLMYGEIPVDLIPFGKIADPAETVNWPGQFRSRMKVQGFQEAFNNSATMILDGIEVKVVIPEMLVALKLSSWSLGKREKDAIDIRLILENIKLLCSDLDNDFHNPENEKLFEKYSNDEEGLWISVLGSRIQTLLGSSNLSFYLKNLMNQKSTINSLVIDMNAGNMPDANLRIALEKLLHPLKDGIVRSV